MTPQFPPPLCLALVVCDHAWNDQATNKTSLLGITSSFLASYFPMLYPELTVYVSLAEHWRPCPIRLRLIDVNEERPAVFEVCETPPPRGEFGLSEFTFSFSNLVFPETGDYRIQLFVQQEFLAERRLLARQI
jgi:hypothetical protein